MHLSGRSIPRVPAKFALFSVACFFFVLASCGGGPGAPSPSVVRVALHGTVFGGQQPVSGSTIRLFTVGIGGYGSAATSILTLPRTSGADGGFNIDLDYNCALSNATQVYILATGGNPGLTVGTNNAALALMSALGPCTGLAQGQFININEMSTVASVYSLAQFMGNGTATNGGLQVGATNNATAAAGIANAFATVNALVTTRNGHSPGENLPAGTTIPSTELNTLGNILATCVNTNGTSGECDDLFALTTNGAFTPSNTIDAMLQIALHPGRNVAALFNLLTGNNPFQPSLGAAPHDWTVGIIYSGNGLSQNWGIAVDAQGNVWTANVNNNSLSEFSNTGVAISAGGFGGGGLNQPHYVAIDSGGNAWASNSNGNSISEFASNGTPNGTGFTDGVMASPWGIAVDSLDEVWVGNLNVNVVSAFDNTGTPLPGAPFTGNGELSTPIAVAFDSLADTWIANFNGNSLSEMDNGGNDFSGAGFTGGGLNLPQYLAVDGLDNIWVVSQNTRLSRFSNAGTPLSAGGFGTGGLNNPSGIMVDGLGHPWVCNAGNSTLSGFSGVGQALTLSTGFTVGGTLNGPRSMAIDNAGNVWVSNTGNNTITKVVGLVGPVITPLSAAVTQSRLGQRP